MSSFCKSHFFSKNISIYAIFNDQSFNNTLTNDIISFEQLGPVFQFVCYFWQIIKLHKPCLNMLNNKTLLISDSIWLRFSTLGENFRRQHFKIFSYFSQKTGFDSSCKLSPFYTICMKCQILFSGEKRKYHQFVVCWISPETGNG